MNPFHPGFCGPAAVRTQVARDPEGLPPGGSRGCGRWQLLALMQAGWQRWRNALSPRFAKYQPAARLGNRRVEQRLLRRLARTQSETSC